MNRIFGKGKEKIRNKVWDWENWTSTKDYPVSDNLLDWVIGQDKALEECYLCLDEWVHKLKWMMREKWYKAWEDPEGEKPSAKKFIPAGPYLLLLGDAGCLIGDERIVLADGTITKLEMLGTTHLDDIHVPLYQIRRKDKSNVGIAKVFHRYENQPVIEVITESGKRLVGTYNHPLLTKEGWKRLDELTTKDYLRVITKIPCWKKNYVSFFDEDMGALLGYNLADGGIDKYAVTFYISDTEKDLILQLQSIIRKVFNVNPSLYIRKAHGFNRTVDVHILEINRKWVADKLSFLKEKRVPMQIMQSPNSVVAEFLSWFFTGDGSVFCKGRGKYGISCEQKEKRIELLRDLQMLLLRFSIHSRVKGRHLTIRQGNSIIRFAKHIGFKTKRKQRKLKKLVDYVSSRRKRHNKLWEKIVSIKPYGLATVYDVEVPHKHLFIANGIVSHNTGKSLIGRALAYHLTELYKTHRIKLRDVLCWQNKLIPSEPKISIHNAGEGKKIVHKEKLKHAKKKFLRNAFIKFLTYMMAIVGMIFVGAGFYYLWGSYTKWLDNAMTIYGPIQKIWEGKFFDYMLNEFLEIGSATFLPAGMMMIFLVLIIVMGRMGGIAGGAKGISGTEQTEAPKLIVDNSEKIAPFIDATGHGTAQLFGSIAWDPLQTGGLGTPEHQRTTAGDVHRANLGILYIDEIKNLHPDEAVTLLTVLEEGQLPVTMRSRWSAGGTAAMAVSTEPIPCLTFLVAAGNFDSIGQIHPALMDRIYGYGKVVRMNNDMPNTVENRRKYVQFIAQEIKRFHLIPFNKEACKEVIAEGRRRSGKRDRLTTKFRPLISIIKTSATLAINDKAKVVERHHVKEAIDKHCKTIQKQLLEHEMEERGRFLEIKPEGTELGGIYGLAVVRDQYSGEMTGTVLPVKGYIEKRKKIEKRARENIKGYFEVTGIAKPETAEWIDDSVAKVRTVILQKYGIDIAQQYFAHIDFAQSHGVDGPSAGVTMTILLCSLLEGKPIRQDVAVTGEINVGVRDRIKVTAIGGCHEKIKAAEAWGFKKVVIPAKNLKWSVNPRDYTLEVVGAETLDDYLKECLVNKER